MPLHDAHVQAYLEDEADARDWTESCRAMNEAEDRWVDNGCSPLTGYEGLDDEEYQHAY